MWMENDEQEETKYSWIEEKCGYKLADSPFLQSRQIVAINKVAFYTGTYHLQ